MNQGQNRTDQSLPTRPTMTLATLTLMIWSLCLGQSQTKELTPDAMKCSLMPYQRVGLKWLLDHERGDRKGGILVDGMGLGKAIQALALMLDNRLQKGSM